MKSGMMFLRRTLYQLKKKYGNKLDVYRTLSMNVNQETGKRVSTRQKISIRKAIMLPTTLAHKITIYVINRTFPSGGEYHYNNRLVVVDSVDLPKDFKIQIDDFCVINQHRYEMNQLEILEGEFAYLLTLTETVGNRPTSLLLPVTYDELSLNQKVNYELAKWYSLAPSDILIMTDSAIGSTL